MKTNLELISCLQKSLSKYLNNTIVEILSIEKIKSGYIVKANTEDGKMHFSLNGKFKVGVSGVC